MNLSRALASQDFTTLARVKEILDDSQASASRDALISSLITRISHDMTEYLGTHAVEAQRTEVYEIRPGKRILTLDAYPIDTALATFSVRIGSDPSTATLDAASDLDEKNYALNTGHGWLRFLYTPGGGDYSYARVFYTGGLGTDTADLVANYPELANACDLQVKYAISRLDSLGGSIETVQGATTSVMGEYGWLREVKRTLDSMRRGAV